MDRNKLAKIKELAEEFFGKMTIFPSQVTTELSLIKDGEQEKDLVEINVKMEDPKVLIGQGGQTLTEVQRLLRLILNKKFSEVFYLNLDINDYKKKKTEYLKGLARDLANEVAFSRQEKALPPMPSYERRVIHSELSNRVDVATESQGQGPDRHIVIKPR